MNKEEVQRRVTLLSFAVGKPLGLDKFNWCEDTKTLTTKENNLVFSFMGLKGITIKAGGGCKFIVGDACTIKAGGGSEFIVGDACTITAGNKCKIVSNGNCKFDLGNKCNFTTGNNCVFNSKNNCKFNTGSYCQFTTKSYCQFITQHECRFAVSNDCTFTMGSNCHVKASFDTVFFKVMSNCVFERTDTFERIKLPKREILTFRKKEQENTNNN